MRKMDAADVKMPTYVDDPDGIGRLPKYSPEDLNVVAMDQRIRDLEKHCMTLDATLTMKTSHYDVLEDDLNVVKLEVEQHTTRFRALAQHLLTANWLRILTRLVSGLMTLLTSSPHGSGDQRLK